MTYRTGNHWGVTIVREGEGEDCDCRVDESSLNRLKFHQGCQGRRDQLVAVIVNGDQALAERICTLLNGARTPDVDHTRGAAEALALIRHLLDRAAEPDEQLFAATFRQMLRVAAAELGVSEDAPSGPMSVPVAAEQASGVGRDANRASETAASAYRDLITGQSTVLIGDSCTCTKVGPDPACVVHHGRRARGPKPANPPGCICDGSGRTCPRHGAVL